MFVSHTLRTVFVKTRKTAGTSIELALSTLAGPDDVVTTAARKDEPVRRESGAKPPQNHLKRVSEWRPRDLEALWHRRWPKRFYSHMPAVKARRVLGAAVWGEYFTFAVERNSWDKAVSSYSRTAALRSVPPFSEWVQQCPVKILTSFDLYTEDGRAIVNRVLRYEHLAEELADVWRVLHVESPPTLPRAKGKYRTADADWRAMYTDAAIERVHQVCHREIAMFGYTFDGSG